MGPAAIPTFARCASVGKRHIFAVAVTAWAVVGFFSMTGHAGQARQVSAAGSYSAAQANRGKTLYSDQCVACHGEMLEGIVGPPLTGADFLTDFGGHPVADLIQKIQGTMPQQAPGTLTRAQATDLTAYILQVGKYPAGPDLTDATATQFTLPGGGAAPAAAAVNTAGLPTVTATANLAQFMRAVTFPNANIIFNTQLYDPGKEKPKMPIPYDYVLWGKTVYYGWEAVDEAILALRDTSPMLLLPGRKCQNGRPVPIQNADYQQAVKDLVAFTDELWKAAQTRNQETVSDLSEKLNNTCANCHKVYRDVSVSGGASTGSLTADRCNANPKGGGVAQ
jgi:mono/diheme cytochrome c family protein